MTTIPIHAGKRMLPDRTGATRKGCACLNAPAATRTRDPKLRRLVLYPAELPEQEARLSYRTIPFLASIFSIPSEKS